jgi:hypothetical protein
MDDALKGLPRLDQAALGPCIKCERVMLATGLPLFARLDVKRCGIDANEVRRHMGLAASMAPGRDGLVLAGIMGPKVEPVVVMSENKGVNVCNDCQQTLTIFELVLLLMVETERDERKRSNG